MKNHGQNQKVQYLLLIITFTSQFIEPSQAKKMKGKGGNMVVMMGGGGGGGYGGGGYGGGGGGGGGAMPFPIPMPIPMFCNPMGRPGGHKKGRSKAMKEKIVIVPIPASMMSDGGYSMDGGSFGHDSPHHMDVEMASIGTMIPKGQMGGYGASSRDYAYEDLGEEYASSNNLIVATRPRGDQKEPESENSQPS